MNVCAILFSSFSLCCHDVVLLSDTLGGWKKWKKGRRVVVFFSVLFFLASLLFLFFCFGRNRDRNPVLGRDGGEEVCCCRLEFGKER